MADPRLTGRTRYRLHKSLFSPYVLVGQVEEQRNDFPMGYCQTVTYWRDARVEDLVELAERRAPATPATFFRSSD